MRRILLTSALVLLPLGACSTSSSTHAMSTWSPVSAPQSEAMSQSFPASLSQVWAAALNTTNDLGTSNGYRDQASGKIVVEDASDNDLRIQLSRSGGSTQVQIRGESAQFFLQQLQQNLNASSFAHVSE